MDDHQPQNQTILNPEDITRRMGEMLSSAIKHGCLLDARWWPSWMQGVTNGLTIVGGLLSVEMSLEYYTGRWFADPITRLLILQWHEWLEAKLDTASLRDDLEGEGWDKIKEEIRCHLERTGPEDCLKSCNDIEPDENGWIGPILLSHARRAWEVRLPGLLASYATGNVRTFSLPKNTWQKLAYGIRTAEMAPQKKIPITIGRVSSSTTLRTELQNEVNALKGVEIPYLSGRAKSVKAKKEAVRALQSLPSHSDIRANTLRSWCIYALKNEKGTDSKGYSVSTTIKHLKNLISFFDSWDRGDPAEANLNELEGHARRFLEESDKPNHNGTLDAFSSFQRYRADYLAIVPEPIDLSEFRIANRASPDMVLPDEFRHAVKLLDKAKRDDLALMTILMFRAGLRLKEVVALQASDISDSDKHCELIIQENSERSLKHKTTRRIIPLDILLEPEELLRLRARVKERQSARKYDLDAWLFGNALAVSPPNAAVTSKQVGAALRQVTGRQKMEDRHLRHSFATYLLLTLMLPQEMGDKLIPASLRPVVSLERFERVADRLLGSGRLGGSALHAVSQLLGHTTPYSSLFSYIHLIDLALGLFCSRASVMIPLDNDWLKNKLKIGPDAIRKAQARSCPSKPSTLAKSSSHTRPTREDILFASPHAQRKEGTRRLLASGVKQLNRRMEGKLRDSARAMQSATIPAKVPKDALQGTTKDGAPYHVPWLAITKVLDCEHLDADYPAERQQHARWRLVGEGVAKLLNRIRPPEGAEFVHFIDHHLTLKRRPKYAEREALREVLLRWYWGKRGIRLSRLKDAQAFTRLLELMNFARNEIELSLTSKKGQGMNQRQIWAFLDDRMAAPQLAGRSGWRGSMIVNLDPHGLGHRQLAKRAAEYALLMLAIDLDIWNRARRRIA